MIITVKCKVERVHLVWAVAYMCEHRMGKVLGDQVFKSDVLKFLRDQMSLFGSDYASLLGSNWEEDFKETIPYAEKWVTKRFPEME